MVLQIAELRMHQLARYLLQTLRWKPAFLIDAKVDAWRLSLPRERTEEAKAVAKLTYRHFGVDCDDAALKISFAEPKYLREAGDIRVNEPCPTERRFRKSNRPALTLAKDKESFVLRGCWGCGKSHLINEIATALRAAGRHVHIVAFKNK